MHKTNTVIVALGIMTLFLNSSTFAQKYTYSPYSRYGMGDLQHKGYGRNTAMGGTGIALGSSEHLNDLNPASYASMDSMSFFFEAGIKGYMQNLESIDNNAQFSDINFDYFSIGFPIAKWGFASLGLRPASVTGYEFENTAQDPGLGYVRQSAYGTGSISKVYLGLGIKPLKNVSLGAHMSYLFGNLTHLNLVDYLLDPAALSYGRRENLHVNDLHFDFGTQVSIPINETKSFTVGATFSPKTALKGDVESLVARGLTIEEEGELFVDADTLSFNHTSFADKAMELPMSYGIGLAYEVKNKLVLTADYLTNDWSDITFHDQLSTTTNRSRMAAGIEFIPNYRNPNSYLALMRYRIGTHYTKEYLVLNDHQLKDFGISFGVGLPLKRSKTSLNFAFEFGTRGTTDNNLIKENYGKFSVNLTLFEYWFVKQKFE
jgi:hypothetical protein